ncbi:MAG: thioesterase family protein [Phenylobacterium sp.]|nr:thioesterase family protein [Phenylobacterium sp.]
MSAFHVDTRVSREGDRFRGRLSPDWEVTGPNGGYMAAIALRAVGQIAEPGHRPLSLSCQYLNRARSDEVEIVVEKVKSGVATACYSASLLQGGMVILTAQVWTGGAGEGPQSGTWRKPETPSFEALAPRESYLPPGTVDTGFLAMFESRPMLPPGAVNPDGETQRAWIRFREFEDEGDQFLDQARTLIWIDAGGWPAHVRGLGAAANYGILSLDLAVWFHEPSTSVTWMLVDATVAHAAAGFITGHVRMWSEDGRLLAHGSSNMVCRMPKMAR